MELSEMDKYESRRNAVKAVKVLARADEALFKASRGLVVWNSETKAVTITNSKSTTTGAEHDDGDEVKRLQSHILASFNSDWLSPLLSVKQIWD